MHTTNNAHDGKGGERDGREDQNRVAEGDVRQREAAGCEEADQTAEYQTAGEQVQDRVCPDNQGSGYGEDQRGCNNGRAEQEAGSREENQDRCG